MIGGGPAILAALPAGLSALVSPGNGKPDRGVDFDAMIASLGMASTGGDGQPIMAMPSIPPVVPVDGDQAVAMPDIAAIMDASRSIAIEGSPSISAAPDMEMTLATPLPPGVLSHEAEGVGAEAVAVAATPVAPLVMAITKTGRAGGADQAAENGPEAAVAADATEDEPDRHGDIIRADAAGTVAPAAVPVLLAATPAEMRSSAPAQSPAEWADGPADTGRSPFLAANGASTTGMLPPPPVNVSPSLALSGDRAVMPADAASILLADDATAGQAPTEFASLPIDVGARAGRTMRHVGGLEPGAVVMTAGSADMGGNLPMGPAAPAIAMDSAAIETVDDAGPDIAMPVVMNAASAAPAQSIAAASIAIAGVPSPQPADTTAAQMPTVEQTVMEHHLDLARDSAWLDQLARDIVSTAASDSKLRFRLNPEHLGSLHVELIRQDDGAVVRMTTESEAARSMLADAQGRLVAEGRAHGMRITETSVDLNRDGGGGEHARHSGADGQAGERNSQAQHRSVNVSVTTNGVNADQTEAPAERGELYA